MTAREFPGGTDVPPAPNRMTPRSELVALFQEKQREYEDLWQRCHRGGDVSSRPRLKETEAELDGLIALVEERRGQR